MTKLAKMKMAFFLSVLACLSFTFAPAAHAVQTASKVLQVPTRLEVTITTFDCENSPGPQITLDGGVLLSGVNVQLIFRNNINTDVHTTVKDIQTAAAVASGTKIVIPKQPVLGGTGGNPWIWIQLLDNDGNPLTGEIFLGRCVQGLFQPVNDFFTRIVVQAILEVLDCTNNPGPSINVSGSVTFDPGVKVRFVFRNQREAGAQHEADAIVDVPVVPEGFTLQIPKQPVQGGVGGNPWISVRTADSMGQPTSTETLLGRCVQLLPGN